MTDHDGDRDRIVRHFLGQLSEPDDESIQRRRAEDPAYDELCQAIEGELIDDFVRGRLTAEQARRFREYYLVTPERSDNVRFAQAMLRSFANRSAAPRRTLAFATVAAFCLVGGFGIASLLRKPAAQAISCVLLPGIRRDAEVPQSIAVLRSTVMLQLHLRRDTELSGDRAVLRPVGGDEIWRQRVLPGADRETEVTVPAGTLTDGDYLLTLESGRQPVASYYFRIVRR